MTAPVQVLTGFSTGNTEPAPYPFAAGTMAPESIVDSRRSIQVMPIWYFRGSGRIAGTVKVIDTAAPGRRVRLYDKESGRLAREVVSDASGLYSFELVDTRRTYYVTAEDNPGGYNATIEDFVVPT